MARSINVTVHTEHDDTDDALRSVLMGMKRAGYEYIDYKILSQSASSGVVTGTAHAGLIVAEPDCEKSGTTVNSQPDPTEPHPGFTKFLNELKSDPEARQAFEDAQKRNDSEA